MVNKNTSDLFKGEQLDQSQFGCAIYYGKSLSKLYRLHHIADDETVSY